MIEIKHLTKSYFSGRFFDVQEKKVIVDLSLLAKNGQITGLIGPNGAGKTTTFNILSGVVRASAGLVEVDGIEQRADLSNALDIRSRIAVLPEKPGLPGSKSGRFAIFEMAAMHGVSPRLAAQRLKVLDEKLELSPFIGDLCHGYSRGQAARAALARLLVLDKPNVVLDEPTVGLDFESARAVRQMIKQLARENKAVLMATHLVADIRQLCSCVVGLKDGLSVPQTEVLDWMSEDSAHNDASQSL